MRTPLLVAALTLAAFAQTTPVVVDGRRRVPLDGRPPRRGFPEYNETAAASSDSAAADQWFAAYRDHAAVKSMKELRAAHGIFFDAVPSLAST
jgi:hypothetical protein